MTEANASAPEDTQVTFHVKSAGAAKYTLTLPLSTTAIDLKNKLATEEYANVPASAQRLIYSGKVLKDGDTLASHNVKEGNTMHLVKSAASNQRQNPASSPAASVPGTTPSEQATGVPQNLASGTGNDPLAGLTGARYAGFTQLPNASMFDPPSPEDMVRQLQDPNFAQMMREAMNNPQFVDMMINSHPQLRAMGPAARQMLQSDQFRRMMTDPESIRQMAQMQQMFGGGGMGGLGGMGGGGGQSAFPAPGATNTTDTSNQTPNDNQQQQQGQQQQNPFASLLGGQGGGWPYGGMGGFQMPPNTGATAQGGTAQPNSPTANQANPFAALLNPAMFGGQQQQPGQDGNNSNPQNPFANNPFLQNPDAMRGLMQALGGGGGGGFNSPPDNRPPEERYATQLRQLNEMGFHDFDRNIQALSRSGGDVNGALEYLFSQV
jgi:ubiquilin